MGSSYLKDLALNWPEGDTQIKFSNKHADTDLELAILFAKMENVISRILPFFGSNSWFILGSPIKSEKVILTGFNRKTAIWI